MPLYRKRYASDSLEQLRRSLGEALKWVRQHRFESDNDAIYPPITLSLPPLQNMTSAYSKRNNRKNSIG